MENMEPFLVVFENGSFRYDWYCDDMESWERNAKAVETRRTFRVLKGGDEPDERVDILEILSQEWWWEDQT